MLAETRDLLLRRHALFLHQGYQPYDEIVRIDARLGALRVAISEVSLAGSTQLLLENIRARVLALHDIEQTAIAALKSIMAR